VKKSRLVTIILAGDKVISGLVIILRSNREFSLGILRTLLLVLK
jgi:hypothetical protein